MNRRARAFLTAAPKLKSWTFRHAPCVRKKALPPIGLDACHCTILGSGNLRVSPLLRPRNADFKDQQPRRVCHDRLGSGEVHNAGPIQLLTDWSKYHILFTEVNMGKLLTKSFKVDSEAWDRFEVTAREYGATSAQLLRELVEHPDAALQGIRSSRAQGNDGNLARLMKSEFPQLSPFQLHAMADVLNMAAELAEQHPESRPKRLGFGAPDRKDTRSV